MIAGRRRARTSGAPPARRACFPMESKGGKRPGKGPRRWIREHPRLLLGSALGL